MGQESRWLPYLQAWGGGMGPLVIPRARARAFLVVNVSRGFPRSQLGTG
jgi:hypothetical protein